MGRQNSNPRKTGSRPAPLADWNVAGSVGTATKMTVATSSSWEPTRLQDCLEQERFQAYTAIFPGGGGTRWCV